MDIVGEKMENGDMFIPEVLMAAQAFADEIGADGFAPDAWSASKLAKSMAA